jgi:hypothetical protein
MTSREINYDEWEGDMKSRVFWTTVMYETILAQELDLPSSGLARLEDYVPIPKFISFNLVGLPASIASIGSPDDAFFQYHFLAQVAHRIILTRIRHSLYLFCKFFFWGVLFNGLPKLTTCYYSRVRHCPSSRRKRRNAPSNRAMASQPPSSNPILRFRQQQRASPFFVVFYYYPTRTRPSNFLPRHRRRRSHAPRALPNRQIPHRPSLPLQSTPYPRLFNGRRL